MSIRVFASRLSAAKMFALQKSQYSEKLLMTDAVPAGGTVLARTAVSNLGHFLCLYMTGHFSTLRLDAPAGQIIDDAVSHLRGQLIDGAGQRKLFDNRIPLDMFLSPGRERDNTAVNAVTPDIVAPLADTAPPPFPLFYPQEFEYLYSMNSDILMDIANDSDTPIDFEICFHGIRILSSETTQGVRGR